MATNWNIDSYIRGIVINGARFCDTVYTATLVANTNQRLTVPSTAGMGLPGTTLYNDFLSTNSRFLAIITTQNSANAYMTIDKPGSLPIAAVPAGGAFALSGSVLIPSGQLYGVNVYAGQVMAFITAAGAAACDVSVSFYAISET